MVQNLKKMIVLALNMFFIVSCGWLLWSYVDEIVCRDGDKTACVNKDLPLGFLLILEQNLKMIILLGVSMLFQGSCRWLQWSYVVEILLLDKDKTGYVNKVLVIDILLFFEGCQVPTLSRI